MNDLRFQVDTDAFNDAIRAYVTRLGVELPKALRTQSRLLFKFVIDRTPPKTRAEGRRRVTRQIEMAIRPLDPKSFESDSVRRLIRERQYEVLGKILSGRGVVPFSADVHHRARDPHGRVRKETGYLTPDTSEVRDYIGVMQANVGRAKGGWVPAYKAAGGKPAAWLDRWSSMGAVEDRLSDSGGPYIQAENRSEWATHGDDERIVAGAMAARQQAILDDIEKRLERAAAGGP